MTSPLPQLLIVDDDPALRDLLTRYLKEQGFAVSCTPDGEAMKLHLTENTPDLIIMDLMLPGEDGLSLSRYLRANTDIPVIILSAKGEDIDRIIGLEVGADDYLAKPFNPRELVARIRAVLRRNNSSTSAAETTAAEDGLFYFGKYVLNMNNYSLRMENEDVSVTSGELALLGVLAQHPNHLLSRDHLIDLLKGYDRSPFDRSIDVRITRLRQKIESDPKKPCYIQTIWGKGYMFTPKGDSG
ncbi:MAG: response regulator [Proteobacteria bacterium]|nr:response regulator [Pseudomonadota bacterium]